MADRKLLTLHTPFNLSESMTNLLAAVNETFGAVKVRPTKTGIVFYVDSWNVAKRGL